MNACVKMLAVGCLASWLLLSDASEAEAWDGYASASASAHGGLWGGAYASASASSLGYGTPMSVWPNVYYRPRTCYWPVYRPRYYVYGTCSPLYGNFGYYGGYGGYYWP